jgi:hypothetical protein
VPWLLTVIDRFEFALVDEHKWNVHPTKPGDRWLGTMEQFGVTCETTSQDFQVIDAAMSGKEDRTGPPDPLPL